MNRILKLITLQSNPSGCACVQWSCTEPGKPDCCGTTGKWTPRALSRHQRAAVRAVRPGNQCAVARLQPAYRWRGRNSTGSPCCLRGHPSYLIVPVCLRQVLLGTLDCCRLHLTRLCAFLWRIRLHGVLSLKASLPFLS